MDNQSEQEHQQVRIGVKNPYVDNAFSVVLSVDATVQDLKRRIEAEHPGKPTIQEQRLIFAGKFRDDLSETLASVLAPRDAVADHHIFHLIVPGPVQVRMRQEIMAVRNPGGTIANAMPSQPKIAAPKSPIAHVAATPIPTPQIYVPSGLGQQLPPQQQQQPHIGFTGAAAPQFQHQQAPQHHQDLYNSYYTLQQQQQLLLQQHHQRLREVQHTPDLANLTATTGLRHRHPHAAGISTPAAASHTTETQNESTTAGSASLHLQESVLRLHHHLQRLQQHQSMIEHDIRHRMHVSAQAPAMTAYLQQLQQFAGPAASAMFPGSSFVSHAGAAATATPGYSQVYVSTGGAQGVPTQVATPAAVAAGAVPGAQPAQGPAAAAAAVGGQANAAVAGAAPAVARRVVFVLDVRLIIKLLFMVYVLGHNGSQERLIGLGVFSVVFYLYRIGCFARLGLRGGLDEDENEDDEFNAAVNANAQANGVGAPGANAARPARRRPAGLVGRVMTRLNVNNFGRIPSQVQENRFLTDAKCLFMSFVLSSVPSWEVQQVPEPAQTSGDAQTATEGGSDAGQTGNANGNAGEEEGGPRAPAAGNGAAGGDAGVQRMAIAAAQ